MENRVKRPPSVWISQILMLLPALVFGWKFLSNTMYLLSLPPLTAGSILIPAYELIFFILLFSAFVGMARRERIGRWLAVLALSVNCIFGIYGITMIVLNGNIQSIYMSRSAMITMLSTELALLLFLVVRLAFGSAANAFFAKSQITD